MDSVHPRRLGFAPVTLPEQERCCCCAGAQCTRSSAEEACDQVVKRLVCRGQAQPPQVVARSQHPQNYARDSAPWNQNRPHAARFAGVDPTSPDYALRSCLFLYAPSPSEHCCFLQHASVGISNECGIACVTQVALRFWLDCKRGTWLLRLKAGQFPQVYNSVCDA